MNDVLSKKLAQMDLHEWETKTNAENTLDSKSRTAVPMAQMLLSSSNHSEDALCTGAQHQWHNVAMQ